MGASAKNAQSQIAQDLEETCGGKLLSFLRSHQLRIAAVSGGTPSPCGHNSKRTFTFLDSSRITAVQPMRISHAVSLSRGAVRVAGESKLPQSRSNQIHSVILHECSFIVGARLLTSEPIVLY